MKQINITILFIIFIFNNVYAENNQKFNEWKMQFKETALANDISENTFNKVMANVRFLPKVIEYDRFQPEFYEDTKTYVSKRASKKKKF